MNYLLDTHILIWYLTDDIKLDKSIKEIILNNKNNIYYSVINLWEIQIKSEKKKLITYKGINDLNSIIIDLGFQPLPLFPRHIYALEQLSKNNKKLEHKDPFDRILIAQAKENKITLITHDTKLKDYKEKCILFV